MSYEDYCIAFGSLVAILDGSLIEAWLLFLGTQGDG